MDQKTENREEYWRERVAAHERSGLSVKQFCEQQQITEQSFMFGESGSGINSRCGSR
jgi:hypothetical protein